MEFFHLMSFLLSHCTSKWKVANDQVILCMSLFLIQEHIQKISMLAPSNLKYKRDAKPA
jgi:hypothetical protein